MNDIIYLDNICRAKKKPPPDIDPNSVQTILHEDKTYYLCTICKSKFLTFQRYLEHQANFDHEELRCTYCGKYFREEKRFINTAQILLKYISSLSLIFVNQNVW